MPVYAAKEDEVLADAATKCTYNEENQISRPQDILEAGVVMRALLPHMDVYP